MPASTTRGRRAGLRDERSRATRRKIVVEATKLFARQGYHKTTVADIASAIGMTQGALFHHFANKQVLLEAVVDRLARGLDAYRALLADGPRAGTVERVVHLMTEHFNNQPEATVCLAALATEFAGTEDPILEKIREVYDLFVGPFEATLRNHPAVTDPRAAAIAFIGAAQGVAIQGLLREGNPSLDDLSRAFLSLLDLPARW